MRKHRVARFVAGILFIAALVIFLIAVYAAIRLSNGGLGGGWGLGWNGWMVLPILISAFFSAGLLMIIGAVVFFLVQIQTNLAAAVQERQNRRPPLGRVPVRPTEPVAPYSEGWNRVPESASAGVVAVAAETAGEAAAGAAAVGTLAAGAVAGGAAADERAVYAPAEPEATNAEQPAAVETPDQAAPTEPTPVEDEAVRAEAAGAEAADAEAPSAGAADVQAARVEILPAEDDLTPEPPIEYRNNGAPLVETASHLPGLEEAARIAAEMDALKGTDRPTEETPGELAATESLPAPVADDLLLIRGVGPVYAQRLQEAGITTYAALAAASDTQLDQLTDGNLARVNQEDWRGQAALLAKE